MNEQSDYVQYRGKCQQMSEELVKNSTGLMMVRGFYYCPIWNREEPHWWCEDIYGNIIDPTAKQFPSKGNGTYTVFDGYLECCQCGKRFHYLEEASGSNHPVCSYQCYGAMVL